MFRTQFDRVRVRSNVGTPIHILYSPVVDKSGNFTLSESGCENIYEFIQSHKDSVDIHVLMQRFENGDASVFSRVQGSYGDFTNLPKSFAEVLNVIIAGQSYFDSLPVDERAKYDHSFEKFIASLDALKDMSMHPVEKPVDEPGSDGDPVGDPGGVTE